MGNYAFEVNKLKLIIHPSFKEQIDDLGNKEGLYPLFGRIYDDFSVCHLMGISSSAYSKSIGYLTLGKKPEKTFRDNKTFEYPFLHIIIDSETIESLRVEIHRKNGVIDTDREIDINLIDFNRLFVRIDQNETPLKIIGEKKVAIIGLGSGGSLLAVYLAKSGVKDFIFVDDDHLETHNIIRHICDLTQLGRFKTKAVKDFIEYRIPDVSITTIERKFSIHTKADADFYLDLFKKVDLIIAVSGEHTVNFALNDFIFSNKLAVPIIYAGTFDGVKGGLMFKVDPRTEDYCYHCIYSDPINIKTDSIPNIIELEKKITYDRNLQEQLAQPGLGLDIDNLTILLSKFCLDILLNESEHGLYQFSYNFYMWFNRTITNRDKTEIKFEGLELYYYEDLEKGSSCPFHRTQTPEKSEKENH
jgi:molybdopterin/thiamine biosynthesis adenylyltransferase